MRCALFTRLFCFLPLFFLSFQLHWHLIVKLTYLLDFVFSFDFFFHSWCFFYLVLHENNNSHLYLSPPEHRQKLLSTVMRMFYLFVKINLLFIPYGIKQLTGALVVVFQFILKFALFWPLFTVKNIPHARRLTSQRNNELSNEWPHQNNLFCVL